MPTTVTRGGWMTGSRTSRPALRHHCRNLVTTTLTTRQPTPAVRRHNGAQLPPATIPEPIHAEPVTPSQTPGLDRPRSCMDDTEKVLAAVLGLGDLIWVERSSTVSAPVS